MTPPLYSVITGCHPRRYQTTLPRAMASVQAQTERGWEHILVVNHGQNPELPGYWFASPPNPGWSDQGAWNFCHGAWHARGRYVTWLGDDDELLPHHLATHREALEASGAGFSLSQVEFRLGGETQFVVGDDSWRLAHLDTTGLVCRREMLELGNWRDTGEWNADWDLVDQWRRGGAQGVFIPQVTGIHHDGWLARQSGLPDY